MKACPPSTYLYPVAGAQAAFAIVPLLIAVVVTAVVSFVAVWVVTVSFGTVVSIVVVLSVDAACYCVYFCCCCC